MRLTVHDEVRRLWFSKFVGDLGANCQPLFTCFTHDRELDTRGARSRTRGGERSEIRCARNHAITDVVENRMGEYM